MTENKSDANTSKENQTEICINPKTTQAFKTLLTYIFNSWVAEAKINQNQLRKGLHECYTQNTFHDSSEYKSSLFWSGGRFVGVIPNAGCLARMVYIVQDKSSRKLSLNLRHLPGAHPMIFCIELINAYTDKQPVVDKINKFLDNLVLTDVLNLFSIKHIDFTIDAGLDLGSMLAIFEVSDATLTNAIPKSTRMSFELFFTTILRYHGEKVFLTVYEELTVLLNDYKQRKEHLLNWMSSNQQNDDQFDSIEKVRKFLIDDLLTK